MSGKRRVSLRTDSGYAEDIRTAAEESDCSVSEWMTRAAAEHAERMRDRHEWLVELRALRKVWAAENRAQPAAAAG